MLKVRIGAQRQTKRVEKKDPPSQSVFLFTFLRKVGLTLRAVVSVDVTASAALLSLTRYGGRNFLFSNVDETMAESGKGRREVTSHFVLKIWFLILPATLPRLRDLATF